MRSKDRRPNRLPAAFSVLVSAEAAQLLEFAIALPLLVVLVVGIFDFGGAFNVKHQLTNAAREGARFGSSFPIHEVSGSGIPNSVIGVRDLVDSYFATSQLNDCGGLSSITGSAYTWAATACGGTLTLTVERAYTVKDANNVDVICTHVNIIYPYQWHFGNVIQLLVPGAAYGGTIQIAADSVMPNMQ